MIRCGRFLYLRYCIILFFVFIGCSREPGLEEKLLGSWRSQFKNIHTILTFQTKGRWTSENRVEGRYSRIVEKKGNIVGEWFDEKNHLIMVPREVDVDIGWQKDKRMFFEIVELTKYTLKLKFPNGRVRTWEKVRAKGGGAGAKTVYDKDITVVQWEPIIVNLSKRRSHIKDRYLCIKMEMALNTPEFLGMEEKDIVLPSIHPRSREAIILYLSSLRYKDVKTYDKVKKVRKKLQDILDPYFNNKIKELTINQIVVTSDWYNVEEEFLSDSSKPKKENKDQIEADDEDNDPEEDKLQNSKIEMEK